MDKSKKLPPNKKQCCGLNLGCYEFVEMQEKIKDLETKLAESERQIKDAREARDMAVDSWCKNRRKYEAQIAEMQNKSFILYSILYETLEKQGSEDIASQIDQMTGWTYDKEADWLKENRNYDQLKQQLHDLPTKIVGEIKEQLFNHFNVKNIEEYEKLPLIDSLFTAETMVEILDTIVKKYGGEDE